MGRRCWEQVCFTPTIAPVFDVHFVRSRTKTFDLLASANRLHRNRSERDHGWIS